MQLVGPRVAMLDTMKDKRIGEAEVIERFGVPPDKVVEVQALAGDLVDNVPGVPGIGVKTAAQLIVEYGDVETLLARAGEIKQPKRRESLQTHAEQALLSKRLVTLDDHVPLDVPLADLKVRDRDGQRLIAFCKAMEFSTLTRRVAEALGTDIDASRRQRSRPYWPPGGRRCRRGSAGDGGARCRGPLSPCGRGTGCQRRVRGTHLPRLGGKVGRRARVMAAPGPAHAASAVAFAASAALAVPIRCESYETVTTLDRLDDWIAEAANSAASPSIPRPPRSIPCRPSWSASASPSTPGRACYVPLGHTDRRRRSSRRRPRRRPDRRGRGARGA